MNLDEIKELLRAVTDTDVTDFELETGEDKIRIRRGSAGDGKAGQPPYVVVTSGMHAGVPIQAGAPAHQVAAPAAAPVAAATSDEAAEDDGLVIVASPIVGTFYESPSPGSPAFVDIGDEVKAGQALCIIEAMKLMNEIEAEVSGVVVKRFVKNSQPVEYGEALFAIRPS